MNEGFIRLGLDTMFTVFIALVIGFTVARLINLRRTYVKDFKKCLKLWEEGYSVKPSWGHLMDRNDFYMHYDFKAPDENNWRDLEDSWVRYEKLKEFKDLNLPLEMAFKELGEPKSNTQYEIGMWR